MNRILIIDDDEELCDLLKDYLGPEGFHVDAVHDSTKGIERALAGAHDFIVLDVMLPGVSGFEVLRTVRKSSNIPVLMLTARGEDVDRIVGLEMGADDYLAKPFNPRELVARIRAIQRRGDTGKDVKEQAAPPERISVGDLELDAGARTVRRGGEPVDLTAVEFDLLEMLLRAAGHVVPRKDLVAKVLGRGLDPFDRSIDVHVSSLRKKLGHSVKGMERIKTIRGVGYLYALSVSDEEHK
ncbi:MAG: response regulator transcription factor [Nitrospiraceae bacterium]|nr:MAG: response regulator transcription factor [Nitrospiraceae bacterium]